MEIRRVTTYEEALNILPLFERLKEKNPEAVDYTADDLRAFLFATVSLPSVFLVVGYEKGEPVGYLLAYIVNDFLMKACFVLNAYIDKLDMKTTKKVWDMLEDWTKRLGFDRIITVISHGERAAE